MSEFKNKGMVFKIKDTTSKPLQQLSQDIKTALKTKKTVDITTLKSYSPEINQQLIKRNHSSSNRGKSCF